MLPTPCPNQGGNMQTTTTTMTDNELAREIRDGNQLAFTMAYDKYQRQLYAFACRYTRNGTLAEDIVQYTFLKLWETRSRLLPASGLAGYLFRIAKNLTLNTLRDYIPTQSEYKDTTAPASEFLPDLERHNLMEQLDKAIGQLSPQKIEVCRLKIHEGLSNAEIAEKLGISINTVKVLYHQAVTQLRKLMHSGYAILLILLVSR